MLFILNPQLWLFVTVVYVPMLVNGKQFGIYPGNEHPSLPYTPHPPALEKIKTNNITIARQNQTIFYGTTACVYCTGYLRCVGRRRFPESWVLYLWVPQGPQYIGIPKSSSTPPCARLESAVHPYTGTPVH